MNKKHVSGKVYEMDQFGRFMKHFVIGCCLGDIY